MADQTFAHTGARVSEALAVRPMDIDLEAASIPIRTLKRHAEHWREIPANLQTTAIYTTAAGLEARDFLARMWDQKADSAGSGT